MDSKKKFWLGVAAGAAALAIVITIVLFVLTSNGLLKMKFYKNGYSTVAQTEQTDEITDENATAEGIQSKLSLLNEYIKELFLYDDVDQKELIEGIYRGYIDALNDPYSAYYSSDEYAELKNYTGGTYGGIGVVASQDKDTKLITVSQVREGSPAEAVGMQMGDIIMAVDGVDITAEELDAVVDMIQGDEGTEVTISVLRNGATLDFTMTRAILDTINVQHAMKEDGVGYIYISKFVGTAATELKAALDDLNSQGMKKLIIDVRSNPGGALDVIIDCCDIFLKDGQTILKVKDKYDNTTTYDATGDAEYNVPMVILTNQYTASAAELFTLAMKDYGLATIVGKTTYGKGVVQQTFDLGDGSAIKLTVEYYYGPNDDCVQDVGITPDYEVEYEVTGDTDSQYNKAMEIIKQK